MDDKELIQRLQIGDDNAFTLLVAAHREQVLNLCYRFLLNREDAEDVSQEVFAEVYHSVRSFRGESRLGTWIYQIAVNKSLDELKRRKRKKRITSIGRTLGLESVVNWLAGADRPDTDLENREGLEHLLRALDHLPENQRIALTLSKMEGYSNPEIAEIMRTTVASVESLIYRARQQLKRDLDFKQ